MFQLPKFKKILMLISSIDLSEPLGGTICWWQLFKNLSALGVDVIVVPFIGRHVESPWWRCYKNPTPSISKIAYSFVKRYAKMRYRGRKISILNEALKLDRKLGGFIESKWMKYIERILQKERKIDAIIMGSLPISIFERFCAYIRSKYGVPLFYYELDMPEVLPEYNTFGYSYYKDADLSIFDGFLSNSDGVSEMVMRMGARNVTSLHYAIDPDFYRPFPVEKKFDIIFSGAGLEGREEWIGKMIFRPAAKSDLKIALTGRWNIRIPKNIIQLGHVPFNVWLMTLCSSKIALNISRFAHAHVYKTSTYRIFELCGLGCSVVTNPHNGIEEWYEPGKEIIVLSEDEDPLETYLWLLSDEDKLLEIGEAAYKRTLREHTYKHRALSLVKYLNTTINKKVDA
jgi:spore maturation protein CgeB